MTEEALVKACLENDRKSQKILYDKYGGQTYGICLRYFKDEFDAQEAMQKTFIKVFKYLNTFKATGALGAWIRRIAITTCVEELMNRKKRLDFNQELNENIQVYTVEHDQMTYDKMISMIDLLPQGYRLVFNMYVLDEMRHAEIAEILQINEATSRSQLLKARKFLQNLFIEKKLL